MSNLVKFREIDYLTDETEEYRPAYIDIESIEYIEPHSDGNPKHCTVALKSGMVVGLAVDMDHMAALVNKVASYTTTCTPEQIQEIKDALIREKELSIRLERQVDNGRC